MLFDILCLMGILGTLVAVALMVYFWVRLAKVTGMLLNAYVTRHEYEARHMEIQKGLSQLQDKHERLESYIHKAVHDIRDSLNAIIPSVRVIMLKVVGVEMPSKIDGQTNVGEEPSDV
jgi:hypothetical protein